MIIKSLYLKNIRSYVEQEISFDKGVSLLAGDIGAGKSTILLAIDFALFGLQRGELSGDALLRNGAEHGVVTLEFSVGENDYKIQRVLKKTGKNSLGDSGGSITQDAGFLSVNGEVEKGTAVELKQRILEILNFPSDAITKKSLIYRYTVYTPQEEMKAILTGDPELRLETLRKLFNIDKYKRIWNNAKVVLLGLKDKKKEIAARIYDLEEKKKKLIENEDKLFLVKPNLVKLEEKLAMLNSELGLRKKAITDSEEKVKGFFELEKQNELCEQEIKGKNDFLERFNKELIVLQKEISYFEDSIVEDVSVLSEMVKNLESELKIKEESLVSYKNKIVEIQTNKKNQEEFVSRLKQEFSMLKKEIESVFELDVSVEGLDAVIAKIKNLEGELKLREEELQSSKKIIIENETKKKHQEHLNNTILGLDNCPTCKQNVSVEHKISIQKDSLSAIAKFNENISKASVFEKDISLKVQEMKEEIEKLRVRIKDIELMKVKKEEISKKKVKFDELINEIKKAEERLQSYLDFKTDFDEAKLGEEILSLKKQVKGIESKKVQKQEFEKKKKKYDELINEIKNIEEKLTSLKEIKLKNDSEIEDWKGVEDEFNALKEEFETFRKLIHENDVQAVALRKDIEFLDKEINGLKEEIHVKEGLRSGLDNYSRIYDFINDEFLSVVGEMEKKVMLRVHSEFNSLFSVWLGTLLNSEITMAVLDDSFSPVLTQNGYNMDYFNLSGGEKTACALAYRLALNQVVNSIDSSINTKDLIILDEPTDGFSPEQLEILKVVIGQLDVAQIVIVSHEPKIESFADHVIRVEKNDSHVSKISYI